MGFDQKLHLREDLENKFDSQKITTNDLSGDSFSVENISKSDDLKKETHTQETKILSELNNQQSHPCQSHQETLQENQNRNGFVKTKTYATIEAYLQRTGPTEYEMFFHTTQEEVQRLMLGFLKQYFEKEIVQDLKQISQQNPTIEREEFTELITSLLAERFQNLSQFKNILERSLSRLQDSKAKDLFAIQLKKQISRDLNNQFSRAIFQEFEKLK